MKSNYTAIEMQIILVSEEDVIRTSQIRLGQGEFGVKDDLIII